MILYRNVAGQEVFFTIVDALTGQPIVDATVAAWIAQDSGAQAAGAGTVDNLGHGQYRYNFTAGDTDGETVGLLLVADGAVPISFSWTTAAVPPEPIPGTGGPLLVTLTTAKRHLRLPLDGSEEGSPSDTDSDLLLKIAQASDMVRAFVTPSGSPPESETWDETTVPAVVQAAVLYQIAALYQYRGDTFLARGDDLIALGDAGGICTEAARALRAAGYRDPVLA